MRPLSISDIYKLECEEERVGDYRWVHPKMIGGFDTKNARTLAIQRFSGSNDNASSEQEEFKETPDTLITDYLAECLMQRKLRIKNREPLPSHLNVTPMQYIDAILYLITELGSPYACHVLGATHFHDDDFLSPQDAGPVLGQLRNALRKSADERTSDLVRTLTLEIFHLGYPWDSNAPRFAEVLMDEEKAFLEYLLEVPPLPPAAYSAP